MNVDFTIVSGIEQCQTVKDNSGHLWTTCFPNISPPSVICLVDEHGSAITITDFFGKAVRLCVPREILK